MAILEPDHPALSDNTAWMDTLKNARIILFELDKAILALTREGLKSFIIINTGQTHQNITHQDLPILIQRRADLIKQIQELEALAGLGVPPVHVQVVPLC
jgi:hypothetical protein